MFEKDVVELRKGNNRVFCKWQWTPNTPAAMMMMMAQLSFKVLEKREY